MFASRIEHLPADTLSKVHENIFGFIRPNVVIFTTPNRDFNVVFPNFEGPFRHWDHKFEFSRSEFLEWTAEVVGLYPDYDVSHFGVGYSTSAWTRRVGPCTQGAVFVKRSFASQANNGELIDVMPRQDLKALEAYDATNQSNFPYRLLGSHRFVYRVDNRTWPEKVLDELQYYIRSRAAYSEEWMNDMPAKISLRTVLDMPNLQDLGADEDSAR